MSINATKDANYFRVFTKLLLLSCAYVLFLIAYQYINYLSDSSIKQVMNIIEWLGVLILLYAGFSWWRKTETIFSPYMILFLFLFLFNFGQSFMWAFGVHKIGELGETSFIRYLSPVVLLKTQVVTCISMLFFHVGALFCYRSSNSYIFKNNSNEVATAFKVVGVTLSLITVPAALYSSWKSFQLSQIYGYSALYYGDHANQGGILLYLDFLFFPSLIALIVGYKFSKRSILVVFSIFFLYMLINLMGGDRGSWIYKLLILLWIVTTNYKSLNISLKKIIVASFGCAFLVLPIVSLIVKNRENGLSSLWDENFFRELSQTWMSSYIDPIFEMGSSMNVLGILLMDKIHDTWGFGSTYIPAILGMVLPRVKTWFGYPDMYVENWLSQDYLGLDHYGVGFSIIGEAYLNFGIYIAPFAMLVMGYLLGSLLYFDAKSSLKNLFRIFVIVTSTSTFTGYARGSLTYHARMWFWGTLLICLVVILLTLVASRYKGNSTHPLDGDMKILG